jgi:formylglycine-generating enzyme required for sulfatase activity
VPAKTAQSNISTQPAATVTTANPPPVLSPSPEPSWLSTIEPNANLQSKDKVASETDWLGQSVANANLQPKNNVPSPELSWPGTIESNANLQPKNNLPRERDWEAIALLMRAAPHITVGAKGREFAEDLNGVKLEMVEIPAGVFYMGRSEGESPIPAIDNNVPRHKVTVQSFWMGKYEVTQAQWRAVMGTNPSHFPGDNLPVHDVSWDDAVEFCRKLSQMTGREYRLPSEAEWEYAARAGTTTPFAFGSHITSLQANFEDISLAGYTVGGRAWRQPAPVGSFPSNNFGLYDMHGNVWEWCQDWYHKNYKGAPNDASAWEIGGKQKERVLRGGGWNSHHIGLYSSYRAYSDPSKRDDDNGLRVVVVLNWLSR